LFLVIDQMVGKFHRFIFNNKLCSSTVLLHPSPSLSSATATGPTVVAPGASISQNEIYLLLNHYLSRQHHRQQMIAGDMLVTNSPLFPWSSSYLHSFLSMIFMHLNNIYSTFYIPKLVLYWNFQVSIKPCPYCCAIRVFLSLISVTESGTN
jgi:hypothetical protein